jgi:choline monooxygenase
VSSLESKLSAFDPDLPLERARTIPSDWYTDPEVHALEREAVFGQTWQMAGRVDQLKDAGSFVTTEIAGEPILVIRGEDGELRAFYNVCRHRAARVALEPAGKATKFRCRYHGWTYDLQGRLRGVPEFDGVADFCREDNGLVPLAVAVWGPLVFVHGGPQRPPLLDYLAPLPEQTAGLGLDRLRFVERRAYELACNWKVFVDNYLDGGYHVNTIHPSLAGVLDYTGYHTVNAGHTSVQISPMRQPDAAREDASAASVRTGANAYYWWLFPNLMVNLYEGIMDTNLVLPLAPDRCRVIFDFYFGEAMAGDAQARSIAVGHQIQEEDVGICADVQRGLGSRAFAAGRYSVRRESGVYHFHQMLARRLRCAASE